MTSVERILLYTKLPQEQSLIKPEVKLPDKWPRSGSISFSNVQLSYKSNHVLQNISFDIKHGEKVGANQCITITSIIYDFSSSSF